MSNRPSSSSYRSQVDAASGAMRQVWHPIGDAEVPGDEYAPYAARVVSLLAGGADDVEIADYLGEVEQSAMGLAPAGPRDLLDVARRIRAAVAASTARGT
jgi:hypothetical protein